MMPCAPSRTRSLSSAWLLGSFHSDGAEPHGEHVAGAGAAAENHPAPKISTPSSTNETLRPLGFQRHPRAFRHR